MTCELCNECGSEFYGPLSEHGEICRGLILAKKKHGPILTSYKARTKAKQEAYTRLFEANTALEKGQAYRSVLWMYFSRSVVSWGECAGLHPDFKTFAEVMVHNDLKASYVDEDMVSVLADEFTPKASDKMRSGDLFWNMY